MNQTRLTACVASIEPLRHTPAGTPILKLQLDHESQLTEAGLPRRVILSLQAVALGEIATQLQAVAPGAQLQFTGFLAPLRQGSNRLVLHIQQVAQAH